RGALTLLTQRFTTRALPLAPANSLGSSLSKEAIDAQDEDQARGGQAVPRLRQRPYPPRHGRQVAHDDRQVREPPPWPSQEWHGRPGRREAHQAASPLRVLRRTIHAARQTRLQSPPSS